jgi:hypothetical protein
MRDRREHVSYKYAIQIEVSDPLSPDQMEQLALATDELIMGNLMNFLGPFGYEGYQDGASGVVEVRDGD